MRVVLIEDDADVRAMLSEALADQDFDIVGLTNAEDAVVLLGAGEIPDVVVTDINLGHGLSGFDLADMARAKHPDVGFVFISGAPPSQEQRKRDRFLRKPFTIVELITSIRDVSA